MSIASPDSFACSSNNPCITFNSSTTGSATAARIFIISSVGASFKAPIILSLTSPIRSARAPVLSSRVIPLYWSSAPSCNLPNSSLYSPNPIPLPRIFFHKLLKLKNASCNSSNLTSFGATVTDSLIARIISLCKSPIPIFCSSGKPSNCFTASKSLK